jgi:uncharacterized protein YdeI (YjbR/CyaY-like superfamily)
MAQTDPRIDAYIAKAAPFAQPLLSWLRAQVHAAAPDVEETIKWSMPSFTRGGRILGNMAAFKAHCAFGFWRGRDVAEGADQGKAGEAMGQFGRITSPADLPSAAAFKALVKAAVAQMDSDAPRVPKAPAAPKAKLEMPADFASALAAAPAAQAHYQAFTPGKQREYLEWVLEAKQAATRERRIAQAVEWIGEGKARNWKYQNC